MANSRFHDYTKWPEVNVDRKYGPIDQGYATTAIRVKTVNHLELAEQSLAEIGFKELSMMTAGHRETLLHHRA